MRADLIIAAKNLAGPALKSLGEGLRNNTKSLSELSKGLSSIGGQAARLGQDFSKMARAGAAAFAKVTATAGALGYGFKRAFVDVAAGAEETGRLLNNSLGREWGAAALKEVRAFSRATGRELGDVAQIYANLQEAGLKPTERHLASIADMAAKKNKSLAEVSAAWGSALKGEAKALEDWQVKTFKTRQKLYVEFKDEMGKTVRLNAPLKDAEKMAALMERVSQARAGGAEADRAQTFQGQLARLGATWQEFRLQVMDHGPWDYLKEQLGGLTAWVDAQDLGALASEWGGHITTALKAVSRGLKESRELLKEWGPRALALGKSLGGLKTAAAAFAVTIGAPLIKPMGNLIRSFALFGKTLAFTPVGILVTLGAGLAGILHKAGALGPLLAGLSEGFSGLSAGLSESFVDLVREAASLFGLAADGLKDANGQINPEAWKELGKSLGEFTGGALKTLIDMLTKAVDLLGKFGGGLGVLGGRVWAGDVISQEQAVQASGFALADIQRRRKAGEHVSQEEIRAAGDLARQGGKRGGVGGFLERAGEGLENWSNRMFPADPGPQTRELAGKLDKIDGSLAKQKDKPQKLEVEVKMSGQVTGADISAAATVRGQGISGAQTQGMGMGGVTG